MTFELFICFLGGCFVAYLGIRLLLSVL